MTDSYNFLMLERKVRTLESKIEDLEKGLHHLQWQNLKMRLEIDVLIDHPDGRAAEKIRHKYRVKRQIRQEAARACQG